MTGDNSISADNMIALTNRGWKTNSNQEEVYYYPSQINSISKPSETGAKHEVAWSNDMAVEFVDGYSADDLAAPTKGYALDSKNYKLKINLTDEQKEKYKVCDLQGRVLTGVDGVYTLTNIYGNNGYKLVLADYTITVDYDSSHGRIYVSSVRGLEGESITITTGAEDGYEIRNLTAVGDSGRPVTITDKVFIMPAENVTVTGEFVPKGTTHPVIIPGFEGGSIIATPDKAETGEEVELTITPDQGYELVEGSLLVVKAENGAKIQMYTDNGSTAQKFVIEKTDISLVAIRSAIDENKVIDIPGASDQNGTLLKLHDYNSSNAQTFAVKELDNGSFEIIAICSGKALDVLGASSQTRTKVQQYDANGSTAQKWILTESEGGSYTIKSECNGLVLDIEDGRAENGASIQMYTNNGTSAQRFIVDKLS